MLTEPQNYGGFEYNSEVLATPQNYGGFKYNSEVLATPQNYGGFKYNSEINEVHGNYENSINYGVPNNYNFTADEVKGTRPSWKHITT